MAEQGSRLASSIVLVGAHYQLTLIQPDLMTININGCPYPRLFEFDIISGSRGRSAEWRTEFWLPCFTTISAAMPIASTHFPQTQAPCTCLDVHCRARRTL